MSQHKKDNITPHPSSPSKHHRTGSSPQSASTLTAALAMQSSHMSRPPVEPNPNPRLPNHFDSARICSFNDPNDPDYRIFESIQDALHRILDSAVPVFPSAQVDYGTIGLDVDDEGYDPFKNPKVIAIQLDTHMIHRWHEVEPQLRSLIVDTYQRNSRPVPPIRYIAGGFQTCAGPAQIIRE